MSGDRVPDALAHALSTDWWRGEEESAEEYLLLLKPAAEQFRARVSEERRPAQQPADRPATSPPLRPAAGRASHRDQLS
jgi:hypothetical protein